MESWLEKPQWVACGKRFATSGSPTSVFTNCRTAKLCEVVHQTLYPPSGISVSPSNFFRVQYIIIFARLDCFPHFAHGMNQAKTTIPIASSHCKIRYLPHSQTSNWKFYRTGDVTFWIILHLERSSDAPPGIWPKINWATFPSLWLRRSLDFWLTPIFKWHLATLDKNEICRTKTSGTEHELASEVQTSQLWILHLTPLHSIPTNHL